jgi:hypothetical protein
MPKAKADTLISHLETATWAASVHVEGLGDMTLLPTSQTHDGSKTSESYSIRGFRTAQAAVRKSQQLPCFL